MNKIAATGRVVADAEIRTTSSGDPVCGFRMASDVGYGERKTTNWFTCSVWGKRGESLVGYLQKGTPVTVFGTLTLREWTNREGVKQLSPEIRIDEVTLHGGRGTVEANQQPKQQSKAYTAASGDMDDPYSDIPF